ncbi:MAG: hypothetical protein RJB61_1581 [Actinomycetota bacterium]|jgi:hypothetical protein
MTAASASGDHPIGEPAGPDVEQPELDVDTQPLLSNPDAHVRIVLDRHTRELGLANVAAIKRALAANAVRRAAAEAGHQRRASGRAA